jgi:hypothetical protein
MLHKYSITNRLHTLTDRRDPLGYIIADDTSRHPARTIYPGDMRIYVACIDYASQRRLFGTLLVNHIEQLAQLSALRRIGLWCASDIEANAFWTSIGFIPARTRQGGRKRDRTHVEYTRPIDCPSLLQFHETQTGPRSTAGRRRAASLRSPLFAFLSPPP